MSMKIKKMNIDLLVPYENNAKEHPQEQIEEIKRSIQEFGNNDPIAVDKNNVVIEGHGRLIALRELGYEEVDVIKLDHLNDEQRRAYTLVHNKLTTDTGYDMDVLMQELAAIDNLDMSELGFSELEDDLREFMDPAEEDEEFQAELPEEPTAKPGDVYQLGDHRLMCGDATSESDVDTMMDGHRADMVFTDPPYGINIVGNDGKVGAENLVKNKTYSKVIADDTTETAEKAYSIFKEKADKLMIWGGNYFVNFLEFSPSWLIWDKRLDMASNNFADGEMVWCNFHTRVRIYKHLWSGMIQEGEREVRVHPTQKPVAMLVKILEDHTELNDKVMDVFGGSGSTLMACEQTDRTCYMMELDPKYVDVIIDRWEEYTGEFAVKVN